MTATKDNVIVVSSNGRYDTQRSELMNHNAAIKAAQQLREEGWRYVWLDYRK